MLFQLADNGTMASVFPHGVLFRGAAEGTIREYLVRKMNALDLEAVSADLKSLEAELASTNETIAAFCRELGIATPF